MPRNHSDPPAQSSPSGGGGPRQGDGGGKTPNTPDSGLPPLPTSRATAKFHSALLLGEDHTELGQVAIREINPKLAIGISRGRFPKGYAHVDPNEDAVFATTDGTTSILAVADGHHGFDAAQAAIIAIAQDGADTIVRPPEITVRSLATAAAAAISQEIPHLAKPRDASRTSLTICLADGTTVAATTIGDTACYIAKRRRVARLGTATEFLAPCTDPASVAVVVTTRPSRASIVVTSDGLVDFAPDLNAVLRRTHKLTASDSVERLIESAFAGGAGDNLAVAVCRVL